MMIVIIISLGPRIKHKTNLPGQNPQHVCECLFRSKHNPCQNL